MSRKIIFAILLNAFLTLNLFAQKSEWKLEKNKDGILVYTREVGESRIKEFKAEVKINAQVDYLVSMLLNVDDYSSWMENVKKAEIVKKINEDEIYIYSVISVPWPFENRDIVTLDVVIRDVTSGVAIVNITGIDSVVPEKKGIVRMPESGGLWKFTPDKDGNTAVVYQYLADPGGGIPDWLVNLFLVDVPFKTIENMRRIAEKNK